jgi:L-malate glycosyltransferase
MRRKPENYMKEPITVMYLTDTCISPLESQRVGGAEKQLYLLAKSLNPTLFEPLVVQLSPYGPLPLPIGRYGNIQLYHFPTRRLYSYHGVRQFCRILQLTRRKRIDILHTYFEKSEVLGWLVAKLANIPVWITSRRDLGFKRSRLYDRLFAFTSRDCSKCIANCHAIKNQMINKGSIIKEKVDVIYNGIDFSRYKKTYDDKALRREIGLKDNVRLVGMVANFYHEIKGHQFFLEAAKIIQEKISDVEFVLVGDGFLIDQYREKAEIMGLNGKVHFLGKRGDVPAILSMFAVSVLCSTSEGLSNTILESMAAGKPVIATRVGGNPELVDDGVTGLLVPPSDSDSLAEAIIFLLQNPWKALNMGSAGRVVVGKKFTLNTMIERYENLYRSFVTTSVKENIKHD